jgi:cell division protein FtsQ
MAIGIDPRLRARRVAVRRAEGRRRLRILLAVAALVVVVAGAWGISRSPLLDLDRVRVTGDGSAELSADRIAEIEAAAALELGTPLIDLDLAAVRSAVAGLPWVARVDVRRDWPGTVWFTVAEREPVAVLRTGQGGLGLIDAQGVSIGPAPLDTTLPLIALAASAPLGEVETDALPGVTVAMAIPDDLRVWVDAVTVEADGAGRSMVGLDLVGSAVVELGSTDLIDDKLAAVRAVLEGAVLTCIDVIDVAVADLTTVTRDPACEAEAPGAEEPHDD